MRNILLTAFLILAAFVAVPDARAYSSEMEQFAQLMNQECDDSMSVTYNGQDIILTFDEAYFSGDEKALFQSIDDTSILVPTLTGFLSETIGADMVHMLGGLFQQYNANMVFRIKLGNNQHKDIVLTAQDLVNS